MCVSSSSNGPCSSHWHLAQQLRSSRGCAVCIFWDPHTTRTGDWCMTPSVQQHHVGHWGTGHKLRTSDGIEQQHADNVVSAKVCGGCKRQDLFSSNSRVCRPLHVHRIYRVTPHVGARHEQHLFSSNFGFLKPQCCGGIMLQQPACSAVAASRRAMRARKTHLGVVCHLLLACP